MSTDITLYEDEGIDITATCGNWGVRIYIGEPFKNGAFGKYADKLLTVEALDNLIDKLESLRNFLGEED